MRVSGEMLMNRFLHISLLLLLAACGGRVNGQQSPTNPPETDQIDATAPANAGIQCSLMLDRPRGKDLTDDDLRKIARYAAVNDRFCRLSPTQISKLRELHPGIFIFRYANVVSGGPIVGQREVRSHPEWVILDSAGDPVPSGPGTRAPLLDSANEEWRTFLADRCRAMLVKGGYDGVMLDVVQMANKKPFALKGIDPATGRKYTVKSWRDAQYGLVAHLRKTLPANKLIVANSVGRGRTYFEEGASRFLEVADGIIAEGFRGPIARPLNKHLQERDWRATVDMIRDVEKRGKYFVGYTKYLKGKVKSGPDKRDSDRFWFVTFLLGMGPRSYYSAVVHDNANMHQTAESFDPQWTLALGAPTGDYKEKGGLYSRQFQHGRVLVNPTEHAIDVDLRTPLRRVGLRGEPTGAPIRKLKLGAHRAELLLE